MPIDPSVSIAPTARVDPGAHIGAGSRVGEYCVIEADVSLGRDCRLEPYVYIKRWTTLGDSNEISAGTVLGSDPLDKNFTGARSYLRLGNANRIREHYTVSRGTEPESETSIGNRNYIMTAGHIAHNCTIGNDVVIASCALVAGYVTIEDQAFLSGGVVVHQRSRIGRVAMVGGNTRVNLDAPPFFLYSGFDITPVGLNVVGLQRAGVTPEQAAVLKRAYRLLYKDGLPLREALVRIEAELPGELAADLVRFCRASTRGICRPRVGKTPLPRGRGSVSESSRSRRF